MSSRWGLSVGLLRYTLLLNVLNYSSAHKLIGVCYTLQRQTVRLITPGMVEKIKREATTET